MNENREKRKVIEKRYLENHPEKRVKYSIRRTARQLGLDPDKLEEFFEEHDGFCDICGEKQTVERLNRLCVDHDHDTGEIRGLLCISCNSGLGRFKDNPALLRNAADYLELVRVVAN